MINKRAARIIKTHGQFCCPDMVIDFGSGESVLFRMNAIAKNKERRQLLEEESIRILQKLREEKEYRIHFDDPFLVLEDEHGMIKKGQSAIRGDNRYAACKSIFESPSIEHGFADMLDAINARRSKHLKNIYSHGAYDRVVKAVIGINDVARKDFGIAEDIILYFADGRNIAMINPKFKKA